MNIVEFSFIVLFPFAGMVVGSIVGGVIGCIAGLVCGFAPLVIVVIIASKSGKRVTGKAIKSQRSKTQDDPDSPASC
jgi:hypothetical protein